MGVWQNRALLFFEQYRHLSVSAVTTVLGFIPTFHSCHCPYCWVHSQTRSIWSLPSQTLVRFQVMVWICLLFTHSRDGRHTGSCFLKEVRKKKKHRKVFWEGFISRKGHVDSGASAIFWDVTFLEYWGHYGFSMLFLEARSKQGI